MKKKKQTASTRHIGVTIALFVLASVFFYGGFSVTAHYHSLYWGFIDALIAAFALDIRSSTLTGIMFFLSWWGLYGTIAIWTGLAVSMALKRYWIIVVLIGLLSLTGVGFEYGIKHVINRERPIDNSLVQLNDPSLPSGHALNSTVLYLSLSYFYCRFTRRFWVSVLAFFLSCLVILSVSFSRIYLGVHYFSDMSAGILFGIGIVAIILGLERLYWTLPVSRRSKAIK